MNEKKKGLPSILLGAAVMTTLAGSNFAPKVHTGQTVDAIVNKKPVKVKVLGVKGDYMDGKVNGKIRLFWYNGNEWVAKT